MIGGIPDDSLTIAARPTGWGLILAACNNASRTPAPIRIVKKVKRIGAWACGMVDYGDKRTESPKLDDDK